MRILHVVPTYLPARRYGGPIFAVHGLCRSLAARGHDVHVFTTNVDGESVSDVPLDTPVDLDGVTVHYFPSRFPRLYWSPAMRRALAREVGTFHLIHAHSIYLWPTRAAARAAREGRVPCIISPRGMLVRELVMRRSRVAKMVWISVVERRNFAGAAAIHFTSRRELDDAREFSIPLPSPFIVANGLDVESEERPVPAVAEAPYFLFLGRINWKKGLDRLVAALKHAPEARLLVAGNDEENYTATVETLAHRAGVLDRIRFVGPVGEVEKKSLLRSAIALVLPSYSENFGNVVLEAMAERCPVIVTPEVGLADVVRESGAGVVTSGDAEPLGHALREVASNAGRRREMGERGRRIVIERFTWQAVAAEMEGHYESIVARHRA